MSGSQMPDPLPIIVLAGSDTRPAKVPEGMQHDQMLTGPKGTIQLRTGRCLAAELVERIRASQCFAEPLLLGPRSWYQGKIDCELIHVEGTLVQTLRQLASTVKDRFDGHQPITVTTCDILPSGADFQQLLTKDYAPVADAMFWWQMIEAQPEDMGAGSWKPSYRIPPDTGREPLSLYPGHLVIARPAALRLQLTNRLLELAYRYRNRALKKRYIWITLGAIGSLIAQEVRNLASFQLPVLTFMLPYIGLRDFFKHRRGKATLRDYEDFLAKTFLHRRYHHAAGGRPLVIATTSLLSFAKDIDTKAELEELDSAEPCICD
jgi:hypothetical protein